MFGGFFIAVDVVTLLAATGFAIGLEQFGQLVETVGLGPEVAEMLVALAFGLRLTTAQSTTLCYIILLLRLSTAQERLNLAASL